MDAVDTNVLIYVHDPRDLEKQEKAAALVRSLEDGVLLWQVACEYMAATRKLEPFGYDRAHAWEDLRDMRRVWTTVLPGWGGLDRAEGLLEKYSLSFWDAMILASSLEAGLSRLYSEDLDMYPTLDGLEIVNPFKT